jgi:hypothetical protein
MSRIPLNEEVVEGEDSSEMEFTQVQAEGYAKYAPLEFDVVERYVEQPPVTEFASDPDTRKF